MQKLRDQDIRDLLLQVLNEKYSQDDDTLILNELGVLHGQTRVDVAVVNGILHGYEIKSESDNLLRLPNQIADYNKVFDRMTIVIQRNYLENVKEMIPKWWGIMLITKKSENISHKVIRKGRINPNVDPYALSHFLWRSEALDLLKERGLQKGYLSKPRHELYEKICDSITLEEIKITVNQRLKMRENWRARL